ncbi:MAG: hypothetical protein AMS17_05275 [Spirochaetes bacterium DG_61]|nr:MAG: hypothetical protein AMS17_05275 [Spirochaetes bacterium DG_61]
MGYLIGIDIGSSACKSTMIDEQGMEVATAEKSYPTYSPAPGWYEQDPEDWYRVACETVKFCVEKSGIDVRNVIGIAVDGPAHAFALLDSEGKSLGRVIHWSDLRAIEQARLLFEKYGKRIFDLTLQRASVASSPAQLLWLKENRPEICSRVQFLFVTKDFVRYRLTGTSVTDPYDAVGVQLYDIEKKQWSTDLSEIIDFPIDYLPKVSPSQKIAGFLLADPAREMGLLQGIPVAVGSGDSAVETLSIGAVSPGDCIVKLGTSANVEVITGRVCPSIEYMTYPYFIGESWISIAATNSGARTLSWFSDLICDLHKHHLSKENLYGELLNQAEAVEPGSAGLLFQPFLAGERSPYWDPNLRGQFIGVRIDHGGKHFIRAILEGVAYSLRDCFEVFKMNNVHVRKVRLIGGGTKSSLWCQIISDVLGMEVFLSARHGADIGSALIAGVATGVYSNFNEAHQKLRIDESMIAPRKEFYYLYSKYFSIYREIVRDNSRLGMKMGNILSAFNKEEKH